MSNNRKVSSSMTTCGRKTNAALDSIRNEQDKNKHSLLTLCLHVKLLTKRGRSDAPIVLNDLPFFHSSLKNISPKKNWSIIKNLIVDVVRSPEFKAKFIPDARFLASRGIWGWKGKRNEDENPKDKLKRKAPTEIVDNEQWKSHFKSFGSKFVDKNSGEKIILLDLGIAVFDEKEAAGQLSAKTKPDK